MREKTPGKHSVTWGGSVIDLTLGEIAAALHGLLTLDRSPLSIDSVVGGAVETDSRLIVNGSIFLAKPGLETDGHLFVGAAVSSGAVLAIVEHEVDEDVAQIVVDDVVVALGSLAAFVVKKVRARGHLTVVAITGSNGKTTTKNLVAAICSRVGETVSPRESFNNEVGAPHTMLRVRDDTRFLIVEMGASAIGEIASLVRMAQPDVGVVLTVGLAHAGHFGSLESTLRAKTEMVSELHADDVAVLNVDDSRVASMGAKTRARVVWFGLDERADVRATDVLPTAHGTSFDLSIFGGEKRSIAFRILGEHHVTNALAASAVAHALGIGIDDIVAGLNSVERAERWRMELLGGANGVTIINDAYNASPDSMAAALKTLVQIVKPGARAIAVLGEMSELGDRSGEEHDRIGQRAVRLNIDRLVVVGERARRIHLAAESEGSWNGESVFVNTPDEAHAVLEEMVNSGDTVLVKSSNSAALRFLGDRLGGSFS